MKLPNHENAIISPEKITGMLLSLTHPARRERAKFFMSLGFSVESWQVLARSLHRHAAYHEVAKVETVASGTQYIIDGILLTPTGKTPLVRSIWLVPNGEDIPHFITAYPIEEETTG